MKTVISALCFFCATAAMGQAVAGGAVLNSQPIVYSFPEHTQHATPQPMAQEQNLLGSSTYGYARGERPLWEVAALPPAVPLGDVARMVRKEHATVKKASVVWEN